jgi:hypothetical protein
MENDMMLVSSDAMPMSNGFRFKNIGLRLNMKHGSAGENAQVWDGGLFRRVNILVVTLLITIFLAGCHPRGRQPNFFSSIPAVPPPNQPPQDHLMLWLEGRAPDGSARLLNGDAEATNGALVTGWIDIRRGSYEVRPITTFEGSREDLQVRKRDGSFVTVPSLRCGDPNNSAVRCFYMVRDPSDHVYLSPFNLDRTPYTILAVVRRLSGRGDNYFLMSSGNHCSAQWGGTGCDNNSALHVGWSGQTTARLGQYGNDSVLDPVPAFDGNNLPISLFVARSGNIGKQVAVLERGFNFFNTEADTRLLASSGAVSLGGTLWIGRGGGENPPYPYAGNVPDWRFVGNIIAILMYSKELTPDELFLAQDYLRTRYGPQ